MDLKKKNLLAVAGLLLAFLVVSCSSKRFDEKTYAVFTVNDNNTIKCDLVHNPSGKGRSFSLGKLDGLPEEESLEILNLVPVGEKKVLAVTRKHGLHETVDFGKTWKRVDSGLPPEVIYPFEKNGLTKPVVSHSISRDGRRVAVLVPSKLYLSGDGGHSFTEAPLRGVRRYTELLSVALHADNNRLILLGTATSGVYYSLDGGSTVRRIKGGVPGEPLRHPNFLEEIRSLSFGPREDTFFAGFGSGNGVYRGSISRRVLEKLDDPSLYTYPDGDFHRITSLDYYRGNLYVGTNRQWRKVIPVANAESSTVEKELSERFLNPGERIFIHSKECRIAAAPGYQPKRNFEPDKRALGKRALYISYSFTQRHNYDKLLKLLRHLKFNAVVINLKDDYGTIRVPVDDPMITAVPKAVNPYIDVVKTIKRLQNDGIYVIGRLVAFKDGKLYPYQDYKYAIKNRAGYPYKKGPEKWVDAHSEFVWDYNIAAAKALVKAGVDEVQFDYIRFPDVRGERDSRTYAFKREGQTMREALVSFLKKARSELDVPVSIDIFGYNAVFKWGNWIGQDIAELARHVDVVSPMFYPSHYTGGYGASYGDRQIYYIIYLSCKRAQELTKGVHIRPYIQGFYYKDNWDNYSVDYLGWELDGLKDSGLSDFILWNDLSEYTIFIKGLRKYYGLGEGSIPEEIKQSIPKKLKFSEMVEKPI